MTDHTVPFPMPMPPPVPTQRSIPTPPPIPMAPSVLMPPPIPTPPADAPVRARFTGGMPDYRRLMIRGALLQAVTLGIYRFWLLTDMRRFEWANTEVGGDSAEYTGTAIELLLG